MIFASTPTTASPPIREGMYLAAGVGWGRQHPANPILVEFRRSFPSNVIEAARIEAEWCTEPGARPVPANATREETEHARKVFLRLVRICGSLPPNGETNA